MKGKILFYITIALFLLSCNLKQKEDYIASVNEEKLTIEEFRANFSEQDWEELSKEDKISHLEDWITITLLAQEADRLELTSSEHLKVRIKNSAKNIKANAAIAQTLSKIKISEDDLFEYYKIYKSKYQKKQSEFKIQQIFCKEKSKVDTVVGALRGGLKFKEAAKKFSEERLGATGGYQGFKSKKDVDEAIWNKLESLQKWVYGSVKTEKGYYLVRYYDTREVTIEKSFTEVRDEIKIIVLRDKKKEAYNNLIEELKFKSANISISY